MRLKRYKDQIDIVKRLDWIHLDKLEFDAIGLLLDKVIETARKDEKLFHCEFVELYNHAYPGVIGFPK